MASISRFALTSGPAFFADADDGRGGLSPHFQYVDLSRVWRSMRSSRVAAPAS